MYKNNTMKMLMLLAAVLLLAACEQGPETPLPTLAPSMAPPTHTPPPTNTPNLPPTRDILPTMTPVPAPTEPLPTSLPTATPSPADPTVNITTPSEGTEFVMGSQVLIGGLAQVNAGQTMSVTLVSATGHILDTTQANLDSDVNSWQASLTVPQQVSGPAQVQAAVKDLDGSLLAIDLLPVNLILDTASVDRYLALYRPVNEEDAAAGFNLFFDGRAEQPLNNVVTISLWMDNCQTQVARQSFNLRGSGYWQGFLVVPANVSGRGCAVAEFGEPGSENWREAQVLVDVLERTDEAARAVVIGNPPPGSILTGGQEILVYGTTYNAPDSQVLVSIMLETARILTEGIATADYFGYWEITLFIPFDVEGPGMINASIGVPAEDNYAQTQNLVEFEPGEEPAPATATPEVTATAES